MATGRNRAPPHASSPCWDRPCDGGHAPPGAVAGAHRKDPHPGRPDTGAGVGVGVGGAGRAGAGRPEAIAGGPEGRCRGAVVGGAAAGVPDGLVPGREAADGAGRPGVGGPTGPELLSTGGSGAGRPGAVAGGPGDGAPESPVRERRQNQRPRCRKAGCHKPRSQSRKNLRPRRPAPKTPAPKNRRTEPPPEQQQVDRTGAGGQQAAGPIPGSADRNAQCRETASATGPGATAEGPAPQTPRTGDTGTEEPADRTPTGETRARGAGGVRAGTHGARTARHPRTQVSEGPNAKSAAGATGRARRPGTGRPGCRCADAPAPVGDHAAWSSTLAPNSRTAGSSAYGSSRC